MNNNPSPSPEQTAYADLLFYGCWIGLLIMVITYTVYMSGLLTPHVPPERIPEYWSGPVTAYLAQAQAPVGWGWVSLLNRGDFANFIGIVLLAGLSIFCYLRILPALLRKRDKTFFVLALLQVLVLIFAASGIVGSGAH